LDLEEPLLDDERWDLIKGCFPEAKPPRRRRGRKGGRPPLPARLCFEALLRHLAGGRPWRGLPASFGSSRTVQRRLDLWLTQGSLRAAWRRYLEASPLGTRRAWAARLSRRPGGKSGFWRAEMLGAALALCGGRGRSGPPAGP
jgi:transposase